MSFFPITMEPAMSRTGSTLLIAAMFAVACSDNENNADRGLNSTAPGVDEITVNTTRDVGDNLAIHFQRLAGKPPVGATLVRFDFSETSRELRDGQGVVTGDFIFSALGKPQKKGSISIFYTPGGDNWLRTGLFDVADDVDVASHVLAFTVRDASSNVLMAGALAEARRVDGTRITNTSVTDIAGRTQLEVLPGAFDIEVRQDNYAAVTLRNVTTLEAVQQLGEIRLIPLKSKVVIF
jgi:hypothetical protein